MLAVVCPRFGTDIGREFLEEGEEFGGLGGWGGWDRGAGVDVEVGEGGAKLDGLKEVPAATALEDV